METCTYDATYSEIFGAVLQIIHRLGWTIENEDIMTGTIIASTGLSLRSWGESITIQAYRVGSQTKVSVTSTPEAQLIDWGKSEENERLIIRKLEDIIRSG